MVLVVVAEVTAVTTAAEAQPSDYSIMTSCAISVAATVMRDDTTAATPAVVPCEPVLLLLSLLSLLLQVLIFLELYFGY